MGNAVTGRSSQRLSGTASLPAFVRAVCLWTALAAGLAGCGSADPPLSPLSSDALILAFGDSLTYGTGARAPDSYPAQLAELTGLEVVRSGAPGEVSASGVRRLERVLEDIEPDLVILCHGGNDILRGLDKGKAKENLRRMVAMIRDTGAEVVLIGVPAKGLSLSTAAMYEELADELAIPLEDDIIGDILGDNRLKSDAVHPNAAGYGEMAEAVLELLQEHGALTE